MTPLRWSVKFKADIDFHPYPKAQPQVKWIIWLCLLSPKPLSMGCRHRNDNHRDSQETGFVNMLSFHWPCLTYYFQGVPLTQATWSQCVSVSTSNHLDRLLWRKSESYHLRGLVLSVSPIRSVCAVKIDLKCAVNVNTRCSSRLMHAWDCFATCLVIKTQGDPLAGHTCDWGNKGCGLTTLY